MQIYRQGDTDQNQTRQINILIYRQKYICRKIDKYTDGQIDRQKNYRQTNVLIDKQADRKIDSQSEGQLDKWTDGQIHIDSRQIDRKKNIHIDRWALDNYTETS